MSEKMLNDIPAELRVLVETFNAQEWCESSMGAGRDKKVWKYSIHLAPYLRFRDDWTNWRNDMEWAELINSLKTVIPTKATGIVYRTDLRLPFDCEYIGMMNGGLTLDNDGLCVNDARYLLGGELSAYVMQNRDIKDVVERLRCDGIQRIPKEDYDKNGNDGFECRVLDAIDRCCDKLFIEKDKYEFRVERDDARPNSLFVGYNIDKSKLLSIQKELETQFVLRGLTVFGGYVDAYTKVLEVRYAKA